MSQGNGDYILGSKLYDILKNSATLVLPATGALYFTLSQIWGLPYGEEVVGTVAAVNLFVGAVVKVGQVSYDNSEAKYDGTINVSVAQDGTRTASLDLKNYEDPGDVVKQDEALFKVSKTVQ